MKALIFAAVSIFASAAFADERSQREFYAGGNLHQVDLSNGNLEWTAVELIGGYKHNPFVGGEIRLGAAAENDPNLVGYTSLYYRTESANHIAKTYLLAGLTAGSISVKDALPGEDQNVNFFGFSVGAGVGFVINDRLNFNLEYRLLAKDNDKDLEFTSLGGGVDYRF